ncbi:MAG: PaaI family thioesterase [Rhodoferax sp.]|nr:PaaI family thioesterase [Rhodoferax sp.]MBP9928362.1 PaaI family thioesterase [Rhodoferax sp.]HQX58230.1 PaaI family thioesterase [Burkholderiaceae bacterium]HQZ04743.1 PaaI family thioesterase [Burkholderiaceae bacterium]HRA61756.1 PaaI family thioesterase [Burkholderiaceae bacterium]
MAQEIHIPFAAHLQFDTRQSAGGTAQIAYEARPEHLNSFGIVHGGAVMTLLDVVMASAARSLQPAMGMITIELKTSFMRPAIGALVAHAEVLHQTRKLAFVQGHVENAAGLLCAHATGTFKYAPRPAMPAAATRGDENASD